MTTAYQIIGHFIMGSIFVARIAGWITVGVTWSRVLPERATEHQKSVQVLKMIASLICAILFTIFSHLISGGIIR